LSFKWLRGFYGDYVIVRESRDFVVFLKTSSSDKFIHVSSLPVWALSGLEYNGEFRDYTLNLKVLGENYVDVCVATRNRESLGELFKVELSSGGVHYADHSKCVDYVSTGFPRIDVLVESIVSLRSAWCTSLCNCPERSVKYYEVFLKAKVAHAYSFYKRVKDAWLEYAQEYLGFVYWLLDSVLREHCQLTSIRGLSDVCKRACSSESVEWRNLVAEYKCRERPLRVYLERMISGIKPDILVETLSHRAIIECKQGPPRTWLEKAVKQSKKYRNISDHVVLVTSQTLSKHEITLLKAHYDEVIHTCTPQNRECREHIFRELYSKLL